MALNLESLRKTINETDKEMVALFEKRMDAVAKIAEFKKQHNMKILDSGREKEVITRAVSYLENQDLETSLRFFMEDLLTISRQYQIARLGTEKTLHKEQTKIEIKPDSIIGYYGSTGSYSEEAALEHFGDNISKKEYMTFDAVVTALLNQEIDIGILPVENSSTGIISTVMDLIRDNPVCIIGEHVKRICHHLLVNPGTKLEDIEKVYSHQQGLEQSSEFLKQFSWEQIVYKSTAGSAEMVSKTRDKKKAAIASERCADIYGLEILIPNIHYNQDNYTRFIIIGREPVLNQHCNKISIVMGISHKPGALYGILRLFNERNLNLMKIESRPIIGKPWEYLFFFDFEGNLMDDRVKELLECMKDATHGFRVLGNYRAYEPGGC